MPGGFFVGALMRDVRRVGAPHGRDWFSRGRPSRPWGAPTGGVALKPSPSRGWLGGDGFPNGRGEARAVEDRPPTYEERWARGTVRDLRRSEEHTSELQSLMRTSYAGF